MLQHKERVLFLNPNTGVYQLSRDYRNVYYCPHFNDFSADTHIKVDCSVQGKLVDVHIQHMLKEFNINIKYCMHAHLIYSLLNDYNEK